MSKRNHAASLGSAIHYNEEGANIRILDTDEMLDATNYRSEVRISPRSSCRLSEPSESLANLTFR